MRARSALSGLPAFLGGGINSAVRGCILWTDSPGCLCVYLLDLKLIGLGALSSFPFFSTAFARAWLQNSLSSSNCMNLAALLLNSSKLATSCTQRLSANNPGRKAVSMCSVTTFGIRFWMFITTFLNLLINFLRDSPFYWWIPASATKIRWCDRLVKICVSNMDTNTMKLST